MALFELLAKIKLEGAEQARRGLEDVSQSAHKTAGALSSRLGGAIKDLGGHFADTAGKAALQYRRQIGIYRQALERLLALPAAKIRAVLIFTTSREAVDL